MREFWREKASPIAALMFAAILIGLCVGFAARANATPIDNYAAINAGPICEVLDDFPTIAGVTGIIQGVIEDSGFSPYDAGRTIATAVTGWCPEHLPVLQRFVAVYTPARTFVAGSIESTNQAGG